VLDAVLDEPGGGLLATFDDAGAVGLAALLLALDVGVLAAAPAPVCAAEELGALLVLIGLRLRATLLDSFGAHPCCNRRIS